MKVRRVTIEIEVPWDAEFETVLLNDALDGQGLLLALQYGLNRMYDCVDAPPHQAQVVGEVESPNTRIGEVTEWPSP